MSVQEPIDAPPTGEEIHMPEPSIIPILNAAGLTIAILGVTLVWPVLAFGLALFVVTLVIWIRDAQHELDSLPADHHH